MKKLLLLITLITTLSLNLKASHNIGGEITYEWVSTSMYNVKLILYTDCSGIAPPTSASISYSSSCFSGVKTLFKTSTRDISQVCDTNSLACNGGTLPGITETIYEGSITAMTPCADWVLSYSVCCRNNSPLNIVNPGSTTFYVETRLDNTTNLNNKSPYFADSPRWLIPVNQTSYINAGAYDADGDSLFFFLVSPQSGAGFPLSNNAGYTAIEPFGGGAGTTINSQTGIITTTPTIVGTHMIAVAVNEWRNGQYIGYVIREFNTNVITGMNSLPSITNSTLNFNICAPSDTIQVNLFSIDPTDSITTSVISFPPNSNYVTLRDISTFFTEHTNYLNDTNILELGIGFTTPSENIIAYINVEDNQCPIKGIQSYAIVVTASNCSGPCSITIPLDTITACQTLAQLSANPSGGQPPYTFSWSPATGLSNPNIANPTVSQAHNQNYIVTLTDALGCTSQDSVIVNAYNPVFDTLDICSPDSVLLDFGPGASNYFWQFFTDTLGNTTSLTNTTQTLMATQPGDYMGYAVFSGCGALTSVINVRDTCAPPPCITFDIVTTPPSCPTCNDGTASIINLIGGCPPYAFSWSSGQITQNITGLSSGSYDATVIDGGCCPGELVTCCLACDSVWPGDANSDLIANVYDILPIGVFYSTTETVRPGATSNWNAEWSAGWSTNQGSGANIKHVDCDGDGTIDFNDVNPILLNYNLTHVARWEENSAEGINDPDLYIDIALDTVPTSTPLAIPINFGTAALTADSIYGIAMSITYDASLIDSIAGITVDFSASWLGTEGLDMITLDTNFYDNGKIDIGLVRTDGQMMSGFGNIFTLNIITIDNLSGKGLTYETLAFDFFNVVIIDNVEGLKLFNQQMDSVVIESMTTGINKIKTVNNVHIVPNPNNGNFKIYISDIANSTIEIYNTMGQLVNFNSNKQRGYLKIDMSSFEKGMYFVKVLNKNKAITIKKVIVH